MAERKRATKAKPKRRERKHTERNTQIMVDAAVPGQELEKAAAEVASHAGKTFVDGIARLFGARFAGWIAENEAKAEARRMAVGTEAQIARGRALTDERRRQELKEIRHQEARALAERRLDRLLIEMAREQANFEAITAGAVRQIERDPERDKPRELDDDWMFNFARYAQQVSDSDLQRLWARILASAAVEDKQRISAMALQTMSLMDKRAATDFEKFCRVLVTLSRIYPLHENSYRSEPQRISLRTLQELGLIEEANGKEYAFAEFTMKIEGNILDLFLSRLQLTQRGVEIAQALFSQQGSQMILDEDLAMTYLKEAISTNVALYNNVDIFPKLNGEQTGYRIRISQRSGARLPLPEERIAVEGAPGRLCSLVDWLNDNYVVVRAPNQ